MTAGPTRATTRHVGIRLVDGPVDRPVGTLSVRGFGDSANSLFTYDPAFMYEGYGFDLAPRVPVGRARVQGKQRAAQDPAGLFLRAEQHGEPVQRRTLQAGPRVRRTR